MLISCGGFMKLVVMMLVSFNLLAVQEYSESEIRALATNETTLGVLVKHIQGLYEEINSCNGSLSTPILTDRFILNVTHTMRQAIADMLVDFHRDWNNNAYQASMSDDPYHLSYSVKRKDGELLEVKTVKGELLYHFVEAITYPEKKKAFLAEKRGDILVPIFINEFRSGFLGLLDSIDQFETSTSPYDYKSAALFDAIKNLMDQELALLASYERRSSGPMILSRNDQNIFDTIRNGHFSSDLHRLMSAFLEIESVRTYLDQAKRDYARYLY